MKFKWQGKCLTEFGIPHMFIICYSLWPWFHWWKGSILNYVLCTHNRNSKKQWVKRYEVKLIIQIINIMEVQRKEIIVGAVVLSKYVMYEGTAELTLKAIWNFQWSHTKKNNDPPSRIYFVPGTVQTTLCVLFNLHNNPIKQLLL